MNNIDNIKAAVQSFVEGGDKSDVKLLQSALHEKFENIQNGFFERKGLYIFDKARYINLIKDGTFGGKPRTITYEEVNDLGGIAVCKVLLESDSLKFTSYITAVLDEGAWKVITNIPKITSK